MTIPLAPITRVAYRNTNTDKQGPLSFQPEHVIKFTAPVVTAGKWQERKTTHPVQQRSAGSAFGTMSSATGKELWEKNNCMFLITLQLGLQSGT